MTLPVVNYEVEVAASQQAIAAKFNANLTWFAAISRVEFLNSRAIIIDVRRYERGINDGIDDHQFLLSRQYFPPSRRWGGG